MIRVLAKTAGGGGWLVRGAVHGTGGVNRADKV